MGERRLQPVEGFLSLGGPREALGFPQESIQGQAFLAEKRDESAEGR